MRSFGQTGTVEMRLDACPRLTLFAPSRSRALRKFPGRKFSAVARRKRTAFTSAEMAALKCNAAARRGASSSPRSIRSQRESAMDRRTTRRALSPFARKTAPHASAATIRSSVPHLSSHRGVSPRVEKIARPGVLVLAEAWSRALFSQQRQTGTCCARQHAGTARCRWARLPRVDPLCDRMERGEEEATYGPPHCISAQPFLQTIRPVGFRRATAENFRPEIFEARATLREQSGSTLGRRVYAPVRPRLPGIEECPHFHS